MSPPALVIGLCLAGVGCDDYPEDLPRSDACVTEGAPEDGKEAVILGTTQGEAFVPLQPMDTVTLLHGPQGGQHIYVSTKLYALTAGQWQHKFDFIDKDTGMTAGGSRDLLTACAPGWTISNNIRVYIDDDSIEQGTLKVETYLPPELGGSIVTAEAEILLGD